MQDKTTILFDLDGTLADSGAGVMRGVQHALASYGIEVEEGELRCFVGPPLVDSFMANYGFSPEQAAEAVGRYREYYARKGIYENRLYEGIEPLLAALREAGKRLLVATSKPQPSAEHVLEHFGVRKYFDFVGAAEWEGPRQYKADVIAWTLEQNRLDDPAPLLMVGDREFDILGAKQFGLDAVGVLYGYGSREELEVAGADWIVESVAELGELLLAE